MRPYPFQAPNRWRTTLPSACDGQSQNPPSINTRSETAAVVYATDNGGDDAILIDLGDQFGEIADQLDNLRGESDENLRQTELLLARLDPIERSIMATPARTIAGLGVKARHAAHVLSHYWEEPVDQIDWDAKAIRLLIEAVCEVACMPLPFWADE
jgi:hypothetical protein